MEYGPIVPASLLHVGVAVEGKDDICPTANILRDTNNLPLTDTGWSIITCPNLISGIKMTPRTNL